MSTKPVGRQKKRTRCLQPYVWMGTIGEKIEELWGSMHLPPATRQALRREVLAFVQRAQADQIAEQERLAGRLGELEDEREKLLRALR